jgi:hypothetical protein
MVRTFSRVSDDPTIRRFIDLFAAVDHEAAARPTGQHESYLDNVARDAAFWIGGVTDTPTFLSYLESACQLESVRPALVVLLRTLAAEGTRVEENAPAALLAMADRIERMPRKPPPPPPPPAARVRPSRVVLTHLIAGDRVLVRTSFRTFDGDVIEAGRTLTFLGYHFSPREDGYSLHFEEGGFRLSACNTDENAVLDNTDGRYFDWITG